jgi:hypothetical protein
MKKLTILLFAIGCSISALAQTPTRQDTSCDFFKNVKFKNGSDTLVVKAVFQSVTRIPEGFIEIVKKLYKGVFQRNTFSSQIVFYPENCSRTYQGPIIDYDPRMLNSNAGITIYETCVAFEGYMYDKDTPFFIVTNVSFKP